MSTQNTRRATASPATDVHDTKTHRALNDAQAHQEEGRRIRAVPRTHAKAVEA